MRVCVVLNHMPAPGAGGLEGQVHDVCTGLLDRGVEVQVACRPSLYMPAGNVPLLEHVHTVTADLTPAEIDNRFLGMWRTSQDLAKAENWARYDVVHVQSHHGYHTALRLARMSGSRPALVTTFHLTAIGGIVRLQELGFPQEPDLLQTQPAAVMEATLARLSDRSIAVSQQVHDDLTRCYGLALLEASPCGCVPVAFNVPPASEVVPQTAWLVNEISPQAFARAINAALHDPETPRKAEAGKRAAAAHRFSLDRMVDETLAVYETALRDKPPREDLAQRPIYHPPRSDIVARKSSSRRSATSRSATR